jgi:hypothetical protein
MLSDDELRVAAEKALKLGIECARRPKSDCLANLRVAVSAATTSKVSIPTELPFSLTRAEIADYLSLAAGDPDRARELAAAELALDFGSSLTSKHLQVLANLVDSAPEDDRPTLVLHTTDLLARWLLRKRQVLGPDGRIVVGVKSWGKAKEIVAAWIGDGLARRKNSALAQAGQALPGATIIGLSERDLNKYVAWDGEKYVLRPSRDNVLADDSLIPIGSVRELSIDHPHPGPMDQVEVVIPTSQEHKARRQDAKATAHQGRSAGRHQRRPVDARKELIAQLKARGPNLNARKICELIDRRICSASAPIYRDALAALKSWQMQAPGQRSWVGLYDHPKTHNLVRAYVNKVPPLKTSK